MRLLLAAPDRDLLLTYKKLLSLGGLDVTDVFDGPQLVGSIAENSFDLVILDRSLPRMDYSDAMRLISERGIPSIVLLPRKVTPKVLLEKPGASSYMNFPFLPSDLSSRIAQVSEKAASEKTLSVGGAEIEVSCFRASDGTPYSNEEINILTALKDNAPFSVPHISAYINALNNKFERMGKSARVKYVTDEGYRLVNEL